MWRSLLMLAAALALACGNSTSKRLSGRWVGTDVESPGRPVSAARVGWARGTSLAFSGSTITVTLPGKAPRQGRYEVLEDRDGKIELSVIGHDGHRDRTRLTLETPRLLRWHLDPINTVVMRRPES
jgi:hypothetical protein